MSSSSLWSRIKKARVVQIFLVYVGVSWVALQVVDIVQGVLLLPDWVSPVAVLLLLLGAIIILATAWVQSLPSTTTRADSGELPGSWQVAPVQLGKAIAKGQMPHLTWGRSILGGVFAFWFLFGLAGLYVVVKDRGESFAPTEAVAGESPEGIAVVPFAVSGPDLDMWREGMVDLLATNLDGIGGYRAIDSRTVLARWADEVGEDGEGDLDAALAVARRVGARYALVGTAVSIGGNVRLTGEIYDVTNDEKITQGQVEGTEEEVLDLVDRLSIEVTRSLLAEDATATPTLERVQNLTTSSLPALRAYLEGEALYRKADFPGAVRAYDRAVEADSSFALAWLRLSESYGWMEVDAPETDIDPLDQAMRFEDKLPARDRTLIEGRQALHDGELSGIRAMKQAVVLYPDDPEAWLLLGELYFHYGDEALVKSEDVYAVLEKAVELDPGFAPYYIHLIEATIARGDTTLARSRLDTYLKLAPDSHQGQALSITYGMLYGLEDVQVTFRDDAEALSPHALSDLHTFLISGGAPGDVHREWVMRLAWERTEGPGFLARLGSAMLSQGQVDDLMTELGSEPALSSRARSTLLYAANAMVRPLPADVMDAALSADGCSEQAGPACFVFPGAYAAEASHWEDHAAIVQRARAAAENAENEWATEQFGIVADLLEGYGLWKQGDLERSYELLEEARLGALAWWWWGDWINIWLGDLSVDRGDLDGAVDYFESLRTTTSRWYADYRLAVVYAELGETEKSHQAADAFLLAWQDADPDLPQPDEIREVLEGL